MVFSNYVSYGQGQNFEGWIDLRYRMKWWKWPWKDFPLRRWHWLVRLHGALDFFNIALNKKMSFTMNFVKMEQRTWFYQTGCVHRNKPWEFRKTWVHGKTVESLMKNPIYVKMQRATIIWYSLYSKLYLP